MNDVSENGTTFDAIRKWPCHSGRQDLNLRPLDPQSRRHQSEVLVNKAVKQPTSPACTTACTSEPKIEHRSTPQGTESHNTDMPTDPELEKLIIAWPKLPEAIRAAIIVMVQAAGVSGKKEY